MDQFSPTRRAALINFGMRSYLLLSVVLAGTALAQPVITSGGIANATGYQATLAPDTVFVVFGSGLGPATLATASAPHYPASVGGTSITFTPTAGGAAINAKMVYSVASQIAGLLPSSIAPGSYSVQVTYNNQTSNSETVTVAARSFGIATSNSAGTGAAQATIGNVNGGVSLVRMTGGSVSFNGLTWTLAPAHPGDELVLWGTGGGADPKNDTGGTSGDQTAAGNFSVSVDGTAITPLYSGAASGYPGLWQINFVLPQDTAADCFAYVQVTAGGQLSNGVTIAIAGTGASSCSSALPAATLSKLDSGTGTVTMAGLNIGQLIGSGGSVGGVINQYTVSEFLIDYSGPKFGPCNVLDETYPAGGKEPSAPDSTLDAGTLTIGGPGGLMQTVTKTAQPLGPVYNSSLSIVDGGSYTLSASGGSQVGPFNITTTFPTSFTVPNFSSYSTISRSQPLTVNWSGSGFDLVKIMIIDDVETSTTVHVVAVECSVPASLGTYTVPAAALAYLPANPASFQVLALVTNGGGAQSAESTTDPNTVIPLVSGGLVDFGGFGAYIDYYESTTVQ
jgi:uncharacterized protein (TIGR03437 family)